MYEFFNVLKLIDMMIKRTFVLFYCFLQTLAFVLVPWQSQAWYEPKTNTNDFFPYAESPSSFLENTAFCEDVCLENIPVIKSDDFEWKENISDLLRHRSSTYRFVSLESAPSLFLHSTVSPKDLTLASHPVYIFKKRVILPDYYSFLHRLCPF